MARKVVVTLDEKQESVPTDFIIEGDQVPRNIAMRQKKKSHNPEALALYTLTTEGGRLHRQALVLKQAIIR